MSKSDQVHLPEEQKTKKDGSGCITLFGGIFFVLGVAVLIFAGGKSLLEAQSAKSWPTVQGQITGPNLTSHRNSDDGTTYRLESTATFQYNGDAYTTQRLNVWSDGDSDRDYYEAAKRRLENQKNNKGSVTVYVKESDPTKSILDPSMRWKYLLFITTFGILFGGVGLFIMALGRMAKKKNDNQVNPEFFQATIREGFGAKIGFYFFFAFVFLAFSIFPMTAFMDEIDKGNHWMWLVLLFPLAGLGFLKGALHTWLEWRKFGDFEVTLDPSPARVGSDITGIIPLNIAYQPAQQFQISLICVERSTKRNRSSSNSSNHEKVVWMEEGFARNESSVRGTALRFAFAVPDDLPATSSENNRNIVWRLHLQAPLPGIDLNRSIEIPVASFDPEAPKPRHAVKYSKDEVKLEELPKRICQIEQNEEGLPRFFFPASRNRGAGCFTFIFALIFMGSGIGVGYFVGLRSILERSDWGVTDVIFGGIPIFMGIIFTLIGALILAFAILSIFGSLELNFSRTRTVTRTVRLPFFKKTRVLDLKRLGELKREVGMSSQNSEKPDISYRLVAKYEGRKVTLADGLKGNLICDEVQKRLEEAIQLAGGQK